MANYITVTDEEKKVEVGIGNRLDKVGALGRALVDDDVPNERKDLTNVVIDVSFQDSETDDVGTGIPNLTKALKDKNS